MYRYICYTFFIVSITVDCRSIGIFTHYEQPGDIKLVENCSVNAETFDLAIVREFFEDVASHIVDESDGGQFHIFSPMAASGENFFFTGL